MKSILFNELAKSNNITYDINKIIKHCKEHGINELKFQKGIYEIDNDYCDERLLCISNHGENGPKKIVFNIDSMTDFTVDFGGSTLLCNGVVTPIAISHSKNITFKNMVLKNNSTRMMQARIVAHGEDYIDLFPEIGGEQFAVRNGILHVPLDVCTIAPVSFCYIEFNGDSGEIEIDTSDYTVGRFDTVWVEQLADGNLRFHNVTRKAPIGNRLVLFAQARSGAGVFAEYSSNLKFENIEVRSCFGMGLIAQVCENITLNNFSTRRADGQLYTSNADATHFVNCTGVVTVENCTFEGQLDDALNIHGMYTRIINKTDNEIFVKEMHFQATGIKIFKVGDVLEAVSVDSLIPYTQKTVKSVEYINSGVVKLTLEESTADVSVGDNIENISRCAELVFRNNIVRNNRARGMLIATRGKVLIENNYFHTAGSSINFEANGSYWFESGATKDVIIRSNTFDRCKHSNGWGDAIIICIKRQKTLKDKYYHGKMAVLDNTFNMYREQIAAFDNMEELVFDGNIINSADGFESSLIEISHIKNYSLQADVRTSVNEI